MGSSPLLARLSRITNTALGGVVIIASVSLAQAPTGPPLTINVDWSHVIGTTKTTITLQVVDNPPLRRDSSIHDAAWANLSALHTDTTRLALWYPYPRLAVAELNPATATSTSWNFDDIDPIVEDFFHATTGHDSVFTMSTLPTWMFCDATPETIPASPDEAMWSYESGTKLCDATGRQAADYFARVASWYTRGGLTDELGQHHPSAHHERIAWWEVLNEPEYEHTINIRTYTKLYDQITAAVHMVSPQTRFVGLSLAEPTRSPAAFEYFLNPANHAPHTALDAISFHFYADAEAGETTGTETYSFFAQADAFVNAVRYIEAIRNRLSPHTQIHINEVGCISASDLNREQDESPPAFDSPYWNLCGAVFAYLYAGLSAQSIDVLGASQLLGYPTQFPSVSLLNWQTGAPNARYRVLEMLHEHFTPGDTIVQASTAAQGVSVAAYARGKQRTLLLINKRSEPLTLRLESWRGAYEDHVGLDAANFIHHQSLENDRLQLGGYEVMVVTWPAVPK